MKTINSNVTRITGKLVSVTISNGDKKVTRFLNGITIGNKTVISKTDFDRLLEMVDAKQGDGINIG